MSKVYVVIDIGCHECGVESVLVGTFLTRPEADKAANDCPDWRDGGQTIAQIFEIEAPAP